MSRTDHRHDVCPDRPYGRLYGCDKGRGGHRHLPDMRILLRQRQACALMHVAHRQDRIMPQNGGQLYCNMDITPCHRGRTDGSPCAYQRGTNVAHLHYSSRGCAPVDVARPERTVPIPRSRSTASLCYADGAPPSSSCSWRQLSAYS